MVHPSWRSACCPEQNSPSTRMSDTTAPSGFSGKARVNHKVASFRKIDMDNPHVQHDALEFPNGQVLKITQLVGGQTATVLQLPVATRRPSMLKLKSLPAWSNSRVTLNRAF